MEQLASRLMGMRQSESAMEENYLQELQSKTKLADLYKRKCSPFVKLSRLVARQGYVGELWGFVFYLR